ncbi:MAG: hypothetical protein JWQ66_2125 [Mucilaginibacter sp.]|nr:hypothetical protein [Mucilaginibacter sp.]
MFNKPIIMSSIYRIRPATEKTIEEIEDGYLWFSRPTQFNDALDANIFAFIKSNEPIANAFERLFKDNINVAEESALSGICCFTDKKPAPSRFARFPNARNGLVIEYDKEKLEKHFIEQNGLGDCFKKVEYLRNPALFKSTNEYDILWEKIGEDEIYRTLNEISLNERSMDELFLKMFTQISMQFKKQREFRIILAGRNIPDRTRGIKGYHISIPKESISQIFIHIDAPKDILEKIEKSGYKYSIIGTAKINKKQQ